MNENTYTLHIRRATIKDYPKIKEIQKKGYGKVAWSLAEFILEHILVGGREYIIEMTEPEGEHNLAYTNKRIGFLHMRKTQLRNHHINHLCILPDYQGTGVGTYALNWVKGLCKVNETITLHVRETNEKALGLYKRQGFIVEKRIKWYYKDTEEDAFKMRYKNKRGDG